MKAILTALVMLLALPSVISATDYYADTDSLGGACSDSGPGTINQPFCTINQGAVSTFPGDTIYIRDGTYSEWVTIIDSQGVNSGDPGNPITLKAYPGESPVLTDNPDSGRTYSMSISNVDYWNIEGLTFKSSAVDGEISYGIDISRSDYLTISDCVFDGENIDRTDNAHLIRLSYGCKNILVENNSFVDWKCTHDQDINGVHMTGSLQEGQINPNRFIVVRNNYFRGLSGDGVHCINLQCEDILIEHNTFISKGTHEENGIDIKTAERIQILNNYFSGFRSTRTSASGTAIIVQHNANDITVHGNIIYDSSQGIMVASGTSGWMPDWYTGDNNPDNVIISNNMVYYCPKEDMHWGDSLDPPDTRDTGSGNGIETYYGRGIKIYGNTIAYTDSEGIVISEYSSNVDIRNNIVYNTHSTEEEFYIRTNDFSGSNVGTNLFYKDGGERIYYIDASGSSNTGNLQDFISDTNWNNGDSINSDPLFADPSINPDANFMLTENSPAIDIAETIVGLNDNYEGSGPDLGAFEFSGDPLQTCSDLDGFCCIGTETCPGTNLGLASDCSDTCCSLPCETPEPSCQDWDYLCCDACLSGPHPNLDGDCPGQYCCETCEQETHHYAISRTFYPPVIDGDISEFSGADMITITESTRGTTGAYSLMWDDTALYIAAQVSDTQLNADPTHQEDGRLWEDDSLEILFDTLHDNGVLDDNDYKFFVNVLNVHTDSRGDSGGLDRDWNTVYSSAVIHSGTSTVNDNGDTDSGYIMEIAIPWPEWGVSAPAHGESWGFDLSMNDKDDSDDTIQTVWINSDGGDLNNPYGWGDMLFTHRADQPPRDGCVEEHELIPFIGLWMQDSTAYTMSEMMEAVTLYYSPGSWCS